MSRTAAMLMPMLLWSCGEAETPPSPEPEAEIATRSTCEAVEFEGTALTHCLADPALHAIRMVTADAAGKPYRSFASYSANRGATDAPVVFAMNGGMFGESGLGIGYYVENGARGQELNRAQGGGNFHLLPNGVFFGSASAGWQVLETEAFYHKVLVRPRFGTQSGPMLVIDGDLHPEIADNGESLHIRNAVGVDAGGMAHFVISDAPISFGRLARYFRDELDTPNALYLDGAVSQLWDPARGRIDNGAMLGPLIVVEMRANPQ